MESLERVNLIGRVYSQSIVALLSEPKTTVIPEIVPHLWLGHDSVSNRRVGVVGRPVKLGSLVSPSVKSIIQHINESVPFTFDKKFLHFSFVDFASFSCEHITVDVLIRVDIVWLLCPIFVHHGLIFVPLERFILSPQDLGSLHGKESIEFTLFVHHLDVFLNFGILLVKFVVGKRFEVTEAMRVPRKV